MTSTKEIILEYVCPGLGVLIGNFMFAAPVLDLKAAIDKGDLGDLNPTPWAFMLGNCMGWVLYGTLLQNLWVFFGNAPGLLVSIWLNLGAVKLLYQKHHVTELRDVTVAFLNREHPKRIIIPRTGDGEILVSAQDNSSADETNDSNNCDSNSTKNEDDWATTIYNLTSNMKPAPSRHETLVMLMCVIWVIFGTILALVNAMDLDSKVLMVGIVTNCILIFFYGAPLSTIFTVLKEKHTASIHIPTMMLNTLNSSFWCAYGIAIGDFFLAAPNGLGAMFGGIQIFLYVTLPRTPSSESGTGGISGTSNGKDVLTEPLKALPPPLLPPPGHERAKKIDDDPSRGSAATQSTQVGSSTLLLQSSSTRDVENGIDVASA
ncbi:MAG: hypothetical protein SGBAC_008666 [Bacillariaceae sp.]